MAHPAKHGGKAVLLTALALLVNGCQTINSLGDHLPVVGERCYSSECFTEAGQAESDRIKRMKEGQENGDNTAASENRVPPPPAPSAGYSTKGTPWEQYNGQ